MGARLCSNRRHVCMQERLTVYMTCLLVCIYVCELIRICNEYTQHTCMWRFLQPTGMSEIFEFVDRPCPFDKRLHMKIIMIKLVINLSPLFVCIYSPSTLLTFFFLSCTLVPISNIPLILSFLSVVWSKKEMCTNIIIKTKFSLKYKRGLYRYTLHVSEDITPS